MGSASEAKDGPQALLQEAGLNPTLVQQAENLLEKARAALRDDTHTAYRHLELAVKLLRQEQLCDQGKHGKHGVFTAWQTRRLNEYINQHVDEPIRTCNLAALLNLSTSHFSYLFKQTFGIPPRLYIARLRIEAARKMMLATDEPLTHIALAHGFCDQSHFCRTFRRELGVSPQTWRQMLSQ